VVRDALLDLDGKFLARRGRLILLRAIGYVEIVTSLACHVLKFVYRNRDS
jgi:hypothetical protein